MGNRSLYTGKSGLNCWFNRCTRQGREGGNTGPVGAGEEEVWGCLRWLKTSAERSPWFRDRSSHTDLERERVHTPLMTTLQRFPSNHTRSTCAASKQRAHTPSLYRIEIIMVKSPLAGRWLTPQQVSFLTGAGSTATEWVVIPKEFKN